MLHRIDNSNVINIPSVKKNYLVFMGYFSWLNLIMLALLFYFNLRRIPTHCNKPQIKNKVESI